MIVLPFLALASLFPRQAQEKQQLPVKPPPVPTGVVPLPQGAPPTGPQAPVPPPIQPLPKWDGPIRISPDLRSVEAYIDNRAVTLQEAVAIALFTSRDFAQAAAQLQQAEGRAGQARTALYPTLGANGDITYYDKATTFDTSALSGGAGMSGGTGSSMASPIFIITPQFNPIFTATFALPLDVFGSLRAAASQAQFNAVAARLDVNRVRNEVVYNVKSAFYDVLRAQAQVDVATDSLNNTLTRLNDANKNYGAGTTPRFDVITAQRDVASAQQDLINAQAGLSVNMASLKNTIGLSLKSRLRISDAGAVEVPPGVLPPTVPETGTRVPEAPAGVNPIKPPVVTPPLQTAPPVAVGNVPPVATIRRAPGEVEDAFDFGPEFDGLVQEALRTRPDVLEGDARIAAALRGVQYARRSQLPSLNLALTDTYTPNATGFTRENVKAITLGVTVPIYDGGLARERVKEARGIEASARIDRRTSLDTVQLDVQRAYIALVQARSRVAVANVGLAQAREAFRLARDRYNAGVSEQVGVSPQVELSNAQTALAQAESNGVNALYDYNAARAALDRAVGRFSFTGLEPGYPTPPKDKTRGVKD